MFSASLWFLLTLLIGVVEADDIIQQAIKAFAELHSVDCHILLFANSKKLYEQRVLLDFYKAVVKNNCLPTVVENINDKNTKNDAVSARKHCSKPLRSFIMGNVTHIADYMIAEKRREDIRTDIWLLFVKNDFDQKLITSKMELSIGSEVYIARRTTHGFKFWEIYRILKNNLIRIIYYGNWNINAGLKVNQSTVLERRRDFGGVVFRLAKYQTPSYVNGEDRSNIELLTVLWKLLEVKLNFTTKLVVVPNRSTEYQLHNDVRSVVIEKLARNEIDVSIVELTEKSLSSVDYSGFVIQKKSRIHIKKISVNFDSWFHLFRPLTVEAWYHVVLLITILPVIILSMYCIGRKAGFLKKQCNFFEVCVTVYQMLCLQGGTLRHDLCSISLLFVFFNLWAFLIRTMYSAAFTSSLAIDYYRPPFHSLEGLLANGQYEFGVHRYSPEFDLYYNTDNWFAKKVNQALMEQNISNLPRSYLEGLRRVCSQKKYAFMASRVILFKLQSQIPCELHSLPHGVSTVNTVYAMTKYNEYLPFINRWLLMFNEVGLKRNVKADISGRGDRILINSQSFRSLEFADTVVLQLLLFIGVILSVLLLFAEIVHCKMRRNRRVSCC